MNTRAAIICGLFATFFSKESRAQAGWKWGTDGVNASVDTNPVASDKAGHVYAGAINMPGDYTVYGADMIFNPAFATGDYYIQMAVTKADSNGNFRWAIGSEHSNAAPQYDR